MGTLRAIAAGVVMSIALMAGVAGALWLTRLRPQAPLTPPAPVLAATHDQRIPGSQNSEKARSRLDSRGQDNLLELPKAGTDFVGYWGGNIHSSIRRYSPDLIGTSPDRVSIIFVRQGDHVFLTSELYSSPNQKIVRGPKARVISPRSAMIEYGLADRDLYYVCLHRFRLNKFSNINYTATIDVYTLIDHKLMGVITQTATLKRLVTVRDQLRFSRPARNQVPRTEVAAGSSLGAHPLQ